MYSTICKFVFCIGLLTIGAQSMAQNLKWGKPSADEWAMTEYPSMPEAKAVVLCKTLNVEYTLSGGFAQFSNTDQALTMDNYHMLGVNQAVTEGNTTMLYDVKVRIKVLKDGGEACGNLDIVTFNDEKDVEMYDDFYSFSVMRYEQVKGKVKRHRVGNECYKDERLDANYMVRHVTVPDLKAGDIVEYQYRLFSRRVIFLYDWQLQEHAVPVAYSRCHMEIPFFLAFKMQVPDHPSLKAKVEEGVITVQQSPGDMQAPKRCKSNCYTIEGNDVLPQIYFDEHPDALPAQVKTKGKLIEVLSSHNIPHTRPALPLPYGKRHIMIP